MRRHVLLSGILATALCITTAKAQLYNYTNDLSGTPASVAANTTGSSLARVNGAQLITGCPDGFNSNRFAEATTYVSSRPAIEFSISPNTGYQLNVTSLSVDARRNNKGPVSWRLAYSVDGGASWVDNGSDFTVTATACATSNTITWNVPDFAMITPLYVRIYAYAATSNLNGVATVKNAVVSGFVTFADVDADGYTSNVDCDDFNPAVNPGAVEVCNDIDDNCAAGIDEGLQTLFYADTDGDSYGDSGNTTLACSLPAGYSTDNTDCDDTNAGVNPAATEVCNGVDDDCNGTADDGLPFDAWYADADGDGYGDAGAIVVTCDGAPAGYVADAADCNDADASVNPGAAEVCNGVDDDCDGSTDEGVTTIFYVDADGDGYGDAGMNTEACAAPEGYVADATDCNDGNAAINPGAAEVCNGIDDNCDGNSDEGLTFETYYADADGDGYGDATMSTTTCDGAPAGYVADATDCNDADASVNPGAAEICNGVDEDCDGSIDEGLITTFYADADADGFGDGAVSTDACSAPAGYVGNNADCNDASNTVYPGAPEICDNGIDEDCDGTVDVIATIAAGGPTTFCVGGSVTLNCTTGGTGLSYQWYKNGNPIAGATGASYVVTTQGNYKVTVTKPACSSTSGVITVTVNLNPNATIAALDGLDLCGKAYVRLKANSGVGLTYQWSLNGVAIGGATSNLYYATAVGNYTVTVTTAAGCSNTSAVAAVFSTCRMAEEAMVADLRIMPNPSNGVFNLVFDAPGLENTTAVVTITDLTGKTVMQFTAEVVGGMLQSNVDLAPVAGIYLVTVEAKGSVFSERLMIAE